MEYNKLNKVFKWGMLALLLVSVIILVAGFAIGWTANGGQMTDVLLNWAYIMVLLAVVSVLVIGLVIGLKGDPKSLAKLGIGLGIIAVLAVISYVLASGADAIGLTTATPTKSELKLTDTILNLAYITGAAAVLAIIIGGIRNIITDRKK